MTKVEIIQAHVLDGLKQLPDESVQCVVTSPPYWGLRDYGVEGQIGLEKTIEEYVDIMVEIFREVRRVLRKDGVCFLNLGDSYATHAGCKGSKHSHNFRPPDVAEKEGIYRARPYGRQIGLKEKDLCMIPARVALALQADGWWVRSEITWVKPNPLPESVTDRPTKSTEKIYLLTKSAKYFWDQEAVREKGSDNHPWGNSWRGYKQEELGQNEGGKLGKPAKDSGRNLRDAWIIATEAFPEAHFATFPQRLVETCIKAGTSEKGCCPKCGAPWGRVVEIERGKFCNTPGRGGRAIVPGFETSPSSCFRTGLTPQSNTIGWQPSCKCSVEQHTCEAGEIFSIDITPNPIPCTVLDPFGGSGTVGLVAAKMGRNAILIELKPEYCDMATKRIKSALGMLVEII